MSIEVRAVSKSFGTTQALQDIEIEFADNCIYGLLGNNGAGKTTLLNIIANRLYGDSGQVLIDGESVYDNDLLLGRLFMVGDSNLYPEDMRVSKALTITKLFYPNYDYEYALNLAERFGLNIHKKINSLSTGYSSIFRLVLALSVNTPYLLFDEPVLGLDAQHRDMFYKLLIEKYAQHPCTIILSTHLIAEVANVLEHTVIIRNGKIMCNQSCADLLAGGYMVSGCAALMEQYLADKKVVSVATLGGLKTACVEGRESRENLPLGLEISGVNLQDYFIQLMNEEDRHHA